MLGVIKQPEAVVEGISPVMFIICETYWDYLALRDRQDYFHLWCEDNKAYIVVFVDFDLESDEEPPNMLADRLENQRLFEPIILARNNISDSDKERYILQYADEICNWVRETDPNKKDEVFVLTAKYLIDNLEGDYV